MSIDQYLVDPASLTTGWNVAGMPLVCVDLDRLPRASIPLRLPPVPLIGVGDATHPLAPMLDAVVEAPVTLDRIVAQVTQHPNAAAVTVQMLRAIGHLSVDQALTLESTACAMLQGSAEHLAWIATRPDAVTAPPGHVVVERDGAVLHIAVDRPEARNGVDRAMRDELFDAFTVAAVDPAIAHVEWRATGPAFGVGADLAEFGTTRDPATAHAIRAVTLPAHPLSVCADKVRVHVQGACVGSSLEMAAFAGRLTAAPSAWFQLPELAMGILPGAGGCVSVPRRIGRQRATLMILSGKRIDAATALRWGLVDTIVDEPPIDPGGAYHD